MNFVLPNKVYCCFTSAVILSVLSINLIACQKKPEPEAITETQNTPVATSINSAPTANEQLTAQNEAAMAAKLEREANLAKLENNINAERAKANAEAQAVPPDPEQAIKGTQITDVQYRSESGATMSVVFETSATGVLNAIVSLPNKPKMTLSAPEGQGNNPTYRSTDGNVELVSHGGGTSIDLMQNNTMTNFEAISAEAEVVTSP